MIGGDPEELHDLATRTRRWAAELDDTAAAVAQGRGVQWAGPAADRYRDRLVAHALAVEAARGEVDGLAGALDALGDALAERQAQIRRAEVFVLGIVDDARRTAERLAGVAEDILSFGERAARDTAHFVLDTVVSLPLPGEPAWEGLAKQLGRVER